MNNVTQIKAPDAGQNKLLKDFSASLVVFLVAFPLCMGIALASGVPPIKGLVTGIIGGIVVGTFSGSPLQVSGPAAGLAVIVFEMVREHGISALGPVLIAAGAIQFIAGLLRVGRWFRAISPEVIHGMLAGIGVLIVIQQFHVILDRAPKSNGPANILAMGEAIFGGLLPLNGSREEYAFLIGAITFAVMLLWEKFRPAKLKLVPAALLGIAAATTIAQVFHLDVNRVKITSDFASLVTLPSWSTVSQWGLGSMLGTAAALAFIASAETLLSAAAVEQMQDRVRTNYDKELTAQGIGNMLCGAVGALPMTGVIVRSSANVQAGAETRRSTIMHGVWILLFLFALPSVMRMIPTASLAAVLILVGVRLVKPADIHHLKRFGWVPVGIYAGSLITIVMTNLLTGVLVGIGLSLLKLLWSVTHLEARVEEHETHTAVHLSGVGTFIGIPRLTQTLDSLTCEKPVHIETSHLRYIDHACIDVIETWVKRRKQQGGSIHLEFDHLHRRYKTPISQQVG